MDITSANDAEDMKEFCSLITAISEKTGAGESLSALRAPLQLALFISPICLLFPFQIIKKSFNRQLVITTAIKLGNGKPKLILDIEKCIWRTLFDLTNGTIQPCRVLQRLSAFLPWTQLQPETISDVDRYWFRLGE